MSDVSAPAWKPAFLARIRQAVILVATLAGCLSSYLGVLYWRGRHASLETKLGWDDWIPFRPSWIWPYLLPYVVGPVVAGFMKPCTFAWFLRRASVVVLISLVIFILLPTKTVRLDPQTVEKLGDGFTARMYRNMIEIDDQGGNAAPSLHISLTCLLAIALVRDWPAWWPLWITGMLAVWLSTLFTYQHHILDVITGAGLALGASMPWPPAIRHKAQPCPAGSDSGAALNE